MSSTAASSLRLVTPPGHPPEVWAATIAAAPRLSPTDLVQRVAGPGTWPTLVVAAAHPDDETLGLGRLAHAWSRRAAVVGLLATAGEACLDHVGPRPTDLAALREAEWRAATSALGFSRLRTLGLPDGDLAAREDRLVEALLEVVATADGRAVLAAPWRLDPHPDHQAAGRAAARAARESGAALVEYPIWATFWAEPELPSKGGFEVVVIDHDAADERAFDDAIAAFPSQLAPLRPDLTPVVPAAMLAHHTRQLVLLERASA